MSISEFLSTIPIFSSLTSAELEEMVSKWVVIDKKKNDIIFRKDELADTIYIILEGSVTITIRAFNGEDLVLSVLKHGEMFGELTLFEISKRTATATASEKTRLLKMSRDDYIEFLKKHPDIAIKMLALLSKRLQDTNNIIERQITRNVNDEVEHELTFGERTADSFAAAIGSWSFIIIFMVSLIIWIVLNVYTILFKPVDPYPFILLNLILSCLAAIQAPVIMMSQGRQSKKDHIAADLDYNINLKAELQIEEILVRLDKINRDETVEMGKHLDIQNRIDKVKNELMEKMDLILQKHT